jgi:hypothetical protein
VAIEKIFDIQTGQTTQVEYTPKTISSDEKLEELRSVRSALLDQTDWWASSDLTMTDAQKKYRQDLRDITKTATSLDDVKWPDKP